MTSTLYRISIHPSVSLEKAWNTLEKAGIAILYGSEEEEKIELFAYVCSLEDLSPYQWILEYHLYTLPSIDWEEQWASHGQNFHNGYVTIDFADFNRSAPMLRLQPGSGFGDLSHPTTRLTLRSLTHYFSQQIVIDIGCGSGILTLAAARLGALKAYGIDSDLQALEHSRQNADLNHLSAACFFSTSHEFIWQPTSCSVLILMNMISSEQQVAWASLPSLHRQSAECLTSGIRIEEREKYLAQTTEWGWSLQSEQEESGWLVFYFKVGN